MSISITGGYLEILPLNEIAKHPGGPPKDAIPFAGYPQQHPAEKNKIILLYDPLGQSPAVLEFNMDDILFVEEVHSAVTEQGEGVPLVKLWMRRGSHGMLLEPFEVNDAVNFIEVSRELKARFMNQQTGGTGAEGRSSVRPGSV